jgi:hypothetical protein
MSSAPGRPSPASIEASSRRLGRWPAGQRSSRSSPPSGQAPPPPRCCSRTTGNKMGWGRLFTQKAGTIDEVSTPVYKGSTAVKTTQTYQRSDGQNYHSEIIKTKAQLAGQDLYYGHAGLSAGRLGVHSQNVTFQQWAPEDPEAPLDPDVLQGTTCGWAAAGPTATSRSAASPTCAAPGSAWSPASTWRPRAPSRSGSTARSCSARTETSAPRGPRCAGRTASTAPAGTPRPPPGRGS